MSPYRRRRIDPRLVLAWVVFALAVSLIVTCSVHTLGADLMMAGGTTTQHPLVFEAPADATRFLIRNRPAFGPSIYTDSGLVLTRDGANCKPTKGTRRKATLCAPPGDAVSTRWNEVWFGRLRADGSIDWFSRAVEQNRIECRPVTGGLDCVVLARAVQ